LKRLSKIFLLSLLIHAGSFSGYGQIVINEISQGPNGSKEYVEFLVLGTPCATSCLDLRFWIFDDNNGFLNGTPTSGVGIAAGAARFADNPFWSCIPSGTLITIYNDLDPNSSLPPDDLLMTDGNCNLVIPISSTLFDHHPSEPTSSNSTYPSIGWIAGGDWVDISMANSQDGFQIYDPANLTTPVFSIGWGSANVLGDIWMGAGSASDDVFFADNSIDCDFTNQGNWAQACAGDFGTCGSDDQTPGVPNSAGNAACISTFNNGCTVAPPLIIDSIVGMDLACFGVCSGVATVYASGGALPYTYAWNDPLAQTDSLATGLCAGIYTVTVTEAGGCQDTLDSIVIVEPTLLTSAITASTNPLCFGECTGAATVVAGGGTPPYTYAWNDPLAQTTAIATGLCVRTFDVVVTDANGCDDTSTVIITEPPLITSVISASTNPLCFGECTGTATVVAGGGTPPYTYTWNDPSAQTTAIATGLCVGTFDVVVTDVNGCGDTSTVIISGPPLITSVISGTTNPLCFGDCTGTATVTVGGGTPPHTYIWNDPSAQTTAIATGLCAGTYDVVVTIVNGCDDTLSVIISEPVLITSVISTSTNPLCFGDCTGSSGVTAGGGIPPYTYAWNDPSAQTTAIATGLCVGTFEVVVTDFNGCDDTAAVILINPTPVVSASASMDATCGNNDGQAMVTASGGVGPYSYQWNDPGLQTNDTAFALGAGAYTVLVTDNNGCLDSVLVAVNDAGAPAATITANVNVGCSGDSTGSATVTVLGGAPPYTYTWNDPNAQTTTVATGLPAGSFSATVTDAVGCISNAIVTITEPLPLSLNSGTQSSTCGLPNGLAYVTTTGGTNPYIYTWDDQLLQITDTAIALLAGGYSVLVSDAFNCVDSVNAVVTDIPGAVIQAVMNVDVSCNGFSDGQATALVSGGSTPYSFQWDAGTGNQTDSIAINLGPGTYSVTITDNAGCLDSSSVSITEPMPLVLVPSGVDANCGLADGQVSVNVSGGVGPYSYLWSDLGTQITATASGLFSGIYTVSIVDSNGCTESASVAIGDIPGGTTVILDPLIDASCNGACDGSIKASMNGGVTPFLYLWSDGQTASAATGLCAGTYGVTVTDANGCVSSLDMVLTEPIQVTFISSGAPASCGGTCDGIATVTVTGTNTPYAYSWDAATGNQTDSSAAALCPGDYTVTITDGDGCEVNGNYTVVLDSLSPTAAFVSSADTASLLLSAINFTNFSLPFVDSLSFEWSFGDGGVDTVVNPTHTYSDTGTYLVELIVMNSLGCSDTMELTVVIEGDYIFFAPNSFSPNGDGLNDFFFPQGVGIDNNDFEFYVFDRWGDQIFKSTDLNLQWDGRANKGPDIAQQDVYIWLVITREISTRKPHQYVGHVTLVR